MVRVIRTNLIVPPAAIAQTWGRFILVRPSAALTPRLLAHELAHVDQWRRLGWRFPFAYAYHVARAGFDPYRNHRTNPFEIEAHDAEHDARYREWAERILQRHS